MSFNHYVRPAARVLVREAAERCLDLPEKIPSVATTLLSRSPIYAVDPLTGALGRRLAENTPQGPIKVPLLIAQGSQLVPFLLAWSEARFAHRPVENRCTTAQR